MKRSKGVVQETASWKKGVIANVAPLEGVIKVWCKKRLLDEEEQRCSARNGFLEERCDS
jgi:hypothetical protein